MIWKIVLEAGKFYVMDNVTEYHCSRVKESECREVLKKITNQAVSYWGADSEEDRDVLQFFVTRANNYSGSPGHDYVFEYHVLRDPACLYILNNSGKTVDRIVV